MDHVARRDDEQQYSLWLDKALLRRLRQAALDRETKVAELVRQFIVEGLDRIDKADRRRSVSG